MLSSKLRARRRFCRPRLERLEPRQVLAAGGVLTLDDAGLLSIVGTSKKDRIEISFEGDQFLVSVNGKKDSFAGASVLGLSIDGGSGDDSISLADSVLLDALILGGNGHDKIRGGAGRDSIFGGTGHDHLDGGLGDDWLDGAQGHDKLSGGDGNDTLVAGVGHDSLSGGAGNDTLQGDVGNDKLSGGDGDDTLAGGGGNDTLCGDAGIDNLDGGKGHDKLKGGEGDDSLLGSEGHDELFGDAGNDWLDGGDGHDKLAGGDGDDELKGGAGHDHLDGGAGANLLDGDSGKNKLRNGTEVDFESLPPQPPPPDDFQPLAAALAPWNSQSPFSGVAVYERQSSPGGLETFLHVTLQGFTAGLILPVFVDLDGDGPGESFWVGEIEIDTSGNGSLKLSTIVDEAGEQLLEFEPAAGVTIFIGEDLTGTFANA